ncbi:PIN domain-containing protein [Actinobacteria bacterium YIM 96077]|uniref:PIN domain-containing protein n=1 Tax=Phytoactinopolyspora halophila TaxID=1981511 RepID=A0A329QJK5_9ACTN|nr:PIN domain-containing protein [Phytoactinopolyspora halophila]AYY12607.1 PIN domain-containing protein [Actinobacteria bacterium YIM 96077]RAW12490.1 hypothetical protein DPM12_13900 [Phytoactinopolyspora halophila]
MTDRPFIDTNVFVYAVDKADPAKQERAHEVLRSGGKIVISTQVLNEFYVIVTRKLAKPLPSQDAAAIVASMSAYICVSVDATLVSNAIRDGQRWQLSHWDALMLAAARQSACTRLVTEDLADGAVYDGVTVENPFRDLTYRR